MISDTIDWLMEQLEDELEINVIQALPHWRRPGVVDPEDADTNLPLGCLLLATTQRNLKKRIGAGTGQRQANFELYIFARNERELGELLDLYEDWSERATSAVVSTFRVTVETQTNVRIDNEYGLEQEAHAFFCPMLITNVGESDG